MRMMRAKVTIYAERGSFNLAARMAERLLAKGYEWPSDGIVISQFVGGPEDAPVAVFSAKLNKAGITIREEHA